MPTLCEGTQKAMSELATEIDTRFFDERPSNLRLALAMMSKQMKPDKFMPEAWTTGGIAKACYLNLLRKIERTCCKNPPRQSSTPILGRKRSARTEKLFEFNADSPLQSGASEDEVDAVVDEVSRWAALPVQTVKEHLDSDTGLVNEFSLLYSVRQQFPLHYILFRMGTSHLAHEADSEQLFSGAGNLADSSYLPDNLSLWAIVGKNVDIFMPSDHDILAMYLGKYGKKDDEIEA